MRQTSRAELNDEDAVRDGFANLEELLAALDAHYPGIEATDRVDVVTFSLLTD